MERLPTICNEKNCIKSLVSFPLNIGCCYNSRGIYNRGMAMLREGQDGHMTRPERFLGSWCPHHSPNSLHEAPSVCVHMFWPFIYGILTDRQTGRDTPIDRRKKTHRPCRRTLRGLLNIALSRHPVTKSAPTARLLWLAGLFLPLNDSFDFFLVNDLGWFLDDFLCEINIGCGCLCRGGNGGRVE